MAIYILTGRPRHGKTYRLAQIGYELLKDKQRVFSNFKFNVGVGALKKFKEDIDAIAYFDIDALLTNLSVPIEKFLDETNDLFITRDVGGINGGCLIIKNTDIGEWIVERILAIRNDFNNEQEVIEFLMKSPNFNQWVKALPHPSINSYRMDLYPELKHLTKPEEGMWYEGQFVLHTPALPLEQRASVLRNTKITE